MAANKTISFFLDMAPLQYEEILKRCHRDFDRVRNIMDADGNNVIESVAMRLTASDVCRIVVFGTKRSAILTLLENKLEGDYRISLVQDEAHGSLCH